MSREQVHEMLAQSHGLIFERRMEKGDLSSDEVLDLLYFKKLYEQLWIDKT